MNYAIGHKHNNEDKTYGAMSNEKDKWSVWKRRHGRKK
jgi:hypothetical protein